MAARVPVLAFGSNRCPGKLTWLREHLGLAGPVVVLRARVEGLAAVWAAGLRARDGARPATLALVPGAVETHAVWMATPDQVAVLDRCEGRGERYDLVRLATGRGGHRGRRAARARVDLLGGRPGARAAAGRRGPGARRRRRPGGRAGAGRRARRRSTPGVGDRPGRGARIPQAWPDRVFVYGTLMPGRRAWPLIAPLVTGAPEDAWLPGRVHDTGRGYPALRPRRPGTGAGRAAAGWPTRRGAAACSTSTRARTTGACARWRTRRTRGRRPGCGRGGARSPARPLSAPWSPPWRRAERAYPRVRTATYSGAGPATAAHEHRGSGHRGVRRVRDRRLRPPPDVGSADEEHDARRAARTPARRNSAPRSPTGQAWDARHGQRHRAHQQQERQPRHHQQPHDRSPPTRDPHSALGVARPPDPVTTNGVTMGPGAPVGRGPRRSRTSCRRPRQVGERCSRSTGSPSGSGRRWPWTG